MDFADFEPNSGEVAFNNFLSRIWLKYLIQRGHQRLSRQSEGLHKRRRGLGQSLGIHSLNNEDITLQINQAVQDMLHLLPPVCVWIRGPFQGASGQSIKDTSSSSSAQRKWEKTSRYWESTDEPPCSKEICPPVKQRFQGVSTWSLVRGRKNKARGRLCGVVYQIVAVGYNLVNHCVPRCSSKKSFLSVSGSWVLLNKRLSFCASTGRPDPLSCTQDCLFARLCNRHYRNSGSPNTRSEASSHPRSERRQCCLSRVPSHLSPLCETHRWVNTEKMRLLASLRRFRDEKTKGKDKSKCDQQGFWQNGHSYVTTKPR